jgi:hypothetical protein
VVAVSCLKAFTQQTPCLAARVAAEDCRVRAQAASPQPSGSHFQTRWFLRFLLPRHRATRRSRNRFPTRQEVFAHPGTGGAFTASTDAVPIPSTGTAQKVGPLTSSPPS